MQKHRTVICANESLANLVSLDLPSHLALPVTVLVI